VGLSTIAVMGTGMDIIFPKKNENLAKNIQQNGYLMTEFPLGTVGFPSNFPFRNRIIAGMSHATIIVESKEKGGATLTARCANSYHRDVFAVSGRSDDEFSSGCNLLIQQNIATLITSGKDVLTLMGFQENNLTNTTKVNTTSKISNTNIVPNSVLPELTEQEQMIYQQLEQPHSADQLSLLNALHISEINMLLMNLELKDIIKHRPGGYYFRTNA